MRIILIAIVLAGLMLLLLSFFFDIFTQSPKTKLGLFDYYLPALLTIMFIIWSLILIGTKRTGDQENKYLKLIIIGLLVYALGWQIIYMKFILTKNFTGGLTDYFKESFPIMVALGCSLGLLTIKIKGLKNLMTDNQTN